MSLSTTDACFKDVRLKKKKSKDYIVWIYIIN